MAYDSYEFEILRGDTRRIVATVTVRDEDGEMVADADISGWDFWFTAKSDRVKPDTLAEIRLSSEDGQITVIDAELKKVRIKFSPSDYARIPLGKKTRLYFDLQGRDPAAGGDTATLATGILIVDADTTRG